MCLKIILNILTLLSYFRISIYQISSAWLESRVLKGDKEKDWKRHCAEQESNLEISLVSHQPKSYSLTYQLSYLIKSFCKIRLFITHSNPIYVLGIILDQLFNNLIVASSKGLILFIVLRTNLLADYQNSP